jgi:hypothetical protein
VYSISDSFNANGPAFGGASSIIISRSTDGGLTWQTPVTARLDTSTTVLNDNESVTAEPASPLTAYATWDRLFSPSQNANPGAFNHSPAFGGPAMFSKTTNGGVSWSQGRGIFDPGEKNQTIGNQIVVPTAGPAAGTLIDGFDLILTKGGARQQPAFQRHGRSDPFHGRRGDLVTADRRGRHGRRARQHRRPPRAKQ